MSSGNIWVYTQKVGINPSALVGQDAGYLRRHWKLASGASFVPDDVPDDWILANVTFQDDMVSYRCRWAALSDVKSESGSET